MANKTFIFDFRPPLLSIVLTFGTLFHYGQAFSNDSKITDPYKGLYQKLIEQQPKFEKLETVQTEVGDLPLNEVERIELDELKTELVQETISLQVKLVKLQNQILEIDQDLLRYQKPQKMELTSEDIKNLMQSQIVNCGISNIKGSKAFKITNNRNESIEFLFSDTGREMAPYSKIIEVASQKDGVEITQPSYIPEGQKVEMSATLRYRVTEQGVEFLFVTFLGQRIEDKLFGRSSHDPFRVICKASL